MKKIRIARSAIEDLDEIWLYVARNAGIETARRVVESIQPGDFQMTVIDTKRRKVKEALDRAGGVYTEAAKLLGVHPNYLHRLVKNLGLR